MPTFTAIVLERLLEPEESELVDNSVPDVNLPPSKPFKVQPEQSPGKFASKRRITSPRTSPALYATPEAIPAPTSPSSFTTSPYIINHKFRGEHLSKKFSEVGVSFHQELLGKEPAEKKSESARINGNSKGNDACDDSVATWQPDNACRDEVGGRCWESTNNTVRLLSKQLNESLEDYDVPNLVTVSSERESESEEFYDSREWMSLASYSETEDDAVAESSVGFLSPMSEFHHRLEGLSPDRELETSFHNIESEFCEMRVGLLMEIEKRKQAEESLNQMRSHWMMIREQLDQLGFTLPSEPVAEAEGEEPVMNMGEELRHRFYIIRIVAESIGRGMAKAELEMEMKAQTELKNFEISRLSERLDYYESVNREMSRTNQEAVEIARHDRQKKIRRQRWIWGSIATLATLGAAVLAWTYLPSGKISDSAISSKASVGENTSK